MAGLGEKGHQAPGRRGAEGAQENRLELQKIERLRLEWERERAAREQEQEQEQESLQREKEAEHFESWKEQEHSFQMRRAKLRSEIRIRDGPPKPIKYISAEDLDLAVQMHEPYTYLKGLTVEDMEDLLEDIQVSMDLEQGKNVDFWRDMTTVTEDEIAKLRKLEASGKGPGERRREAVHAAVSSAVQAVFKGKTYNQLRAIEVKVCAGGPNLDMGYWESLLQLLCAHTARARLRERHQDVLRRKLCQLKQEQGVESEPLFLILKPEPKAIHSPEPEERFPQPRDFSDHSTGGGRWRGRAAVGGPGPAESAAGGRAVLEPYEDLQRLQQSRLQLRAPGDASQSAGDISRRAREGMGRDEAQFSVEMPLAGRAHLRSDKFPPRKPRFINPVHTGFEWNKYNQTHYDLDNPPPKIVQGYKFKVFYPDLIAKRATPEYFLEACEDNPNFAILRFHAGPPYEDITFKIARREWDYSHRHGFRCQFANGIFQLWFHFKRYRYRR
ncbi:Cactin [Apodemus speciosus]|uniref:Splicing factor Cactin n=1 Tax=Apodemus speciosus TaxID=105296 RepID=A0ABQ0FCH8_APOSI